MSDKTAVPTDLAEALGRNWEEGWNGEDVDRIMADFAEDVVFSSPFVSALGDDGARTTITGHQALRDYVAAALRRSPGIRYTLDATFAGTDSVVLAYTCHLTDGTDKRGADSMRVDAEGKVVEWRCHYGVDFLG